MTNLTHLYIDTFDGKDINSKTVELYCKMLMVREDDQVEYFDSVLIRGRGNAKKWTLLANHGDKALFRNTLASQGQVIRSGILDLGTI